jgi:hypothetical protein
MKPASLRSISKHVTSRICLLDVLYTIDWQANVDGALSRIQKGSSFQSVFRAAKASVRVWLANCRVRDGALSFKIEDIKCGAWSGPSHTLGVGGRCVWGSGGIISRGNQKKRVPGPFRFPRISHEATRRWTQTSLRGEKLSALPPELRYDHDICGLRKMTFSKA